MFRTCMSFAFILMWMSITPLKAEPLPKIVENGSTKQLYVDDKPFLILAGELHNSSTSSDAYMAPIWPKLKAMNLNTVVSTVSWDMIETSEGSFDFSTLENQVTAARKQGLRLVLIWFGAFKNARSTYAPNWVRADTARFPRAIVHPTKQELFTYAGSMPQAILSPFSVDLQDAERKAFSATIRHLKKFDPGHTVIMVQVDNEIGLLGDSRDRSLLAQRSWEEQVPKELIAYFNSHRQQLRPELLETWGRQQYRQQGTWSEVFGTGWQADEIFMAWAYGRFVQAVVRDSAPEASLPLYVNAWLGPQPGQPQAGDYPSGGPVPRVMDIWKAAAPSIAFIAPDIYIDDFKGTLDSFDRADNPIFIPEAQFKNGNVFWAIGHHKALGFSVFGVEDGFAGNQLSQAYAVLASMSDLITAAQSRDRLRGVLLEGDKPAMETLAGYTITLNGTSNLIAKMLLDAGVASGPKSAVPVSETVDSAHGPAPADIRPFGIVLAAEKDEFFLVGQDFTADFSRNGKLSEIDFVEEGKFVRGQWVAGRRLNGDERLRLLPMHGIGIVRVKLL